MLFMKLANQWPQGCNDSRINGSTSGNNRYNGCNRYNMNNHAWNSALSMKESNRDYPQYPRCPPALNSEQFSRENGPIYTFTHGRGPQFESQPFTSTQDQTHPSYRRRGYHREDINSRELHEYHHDTPFLETVIRRHRKYIRNYPESTPRLPVRRDVKLERIRTFRTPMPHKKSFFPIRKDKQKMKFTESKISKLPVVDSEANNKLQELASNTSVVSMDIDTDEDDEPVSNQDALTVQNTINNLQSEHTPSEIKQNNVNKCEKKFHDSNGKKENCISSILSSNNSQSNENQQLANPNPQKSTETLKNEDDDPGTTECATRKENLLHNENDVQKLNASCPLMSTNNKKNEKQSSSKETDTKNSSGDIPQLNVLSSSSPTRLPSEIKTWDKETSNSTQSNAVSTGCPRITNNEETMKLHSDEKKLFSSPSRTEPVLTCEQTLDQRVADPRTNHESYKLLKLYPIELKLPEFLEECKEYMTFNNTKNNKQISNIIRNRSPVCRCNIEELKKFNNMPMEELEKFCCHVRIDETKEKDAQPQKLTDFTIDTKKSYLMQNPCCEADSTMKENARDVGSKTSHSTTDTRKKLNSTSEKRKETDKKDPKNASNLLNKPVNKKFESMEKNRCNSPRKNTEIKKPLTEVHKQDSTRNKSKYLKTKDPIQEKKQKDTIFPDNKDEPRQIKMKRKFSSVEDISHSSSINNREKIPSEKRKRIEQSKSTQRNKDSSKDLARTCSDKFDKNSKKIDTSTKSNEKIKKREVKSLKERSQSSEKHDGHCKENDSNKCSQFDTDSTKHKQDVSRKSVISKSAPTSTLDSHTNGENIQTTVVPKTRSDLAHSPNNYGVSSPSLESESSKIESLEPNAKHNKNISESILKSSEGRTSLNVYSTSEVCAARNVKKILKTSFSSSNNNDKASNEVLHLKDTEYPGHISEDHESNSKPDSEMTSDELTKSTQIALKDTEYTLHIPERISPSNTDISSDDLLQTLEKTIESLEFPNQMNSFVTKDQTLQKDCVENEDIRANETREMSLQICTLGEATDNTAATSTLNKNMLTSPEKPKGQSKTEDREVENKNTIDGSSENAGQEISNSVESYQTKHKIGEFEGSDDGSELLLQVKVIEYTEVKEEQEENSSLYGIQPEVKLENSDSFEEISALIPTANPTLSDSVATASDRLEGKERKTMEKPATIEKTCSVASSSTRLDEAVEQKSTDSSLRNPICGTNDFRGNTTESAERKMPKTIVELFKLMTSSEISHLPTETQLENSEEAQTNTTIAQSPFSSNHLQSGREFTEVQRTRCNANTTRDITRPSSVSELTSSSVPVSMMTTKQNIRCLNPTTTIPNNTVTNASGPIRRDVIEEKEQPNASSVASNRRSSVSYSSSNNDNTNLLAEFSNTQRELPMLLNSKNVPDRPNIPKEMSFKIIKMVNAYTLSRNYGQSFVKLVQNLGRFAPLDTEVLSIHSAMTKTKQVFGDFLLQYMLNLPQNVSNAVVFASYFAEFVIGSVRNEGNDSQIIYRILELVNVHRKEYEKFPVLKYFSNYIANDANVVQKITDISMTFVQYRTLKQQIFRYLKLLNGGYYEGNGQILSRRQDSSHVAPKVLPNSNKESTITATLPSIISSSASSSILNNSSRLQQNRIVGNATVHSTLLQDQPAYTAGSRKRPFTVFFEPSFSNQSSQYDKSSYVPSRKKTNRGDTCNILQSSAVNQSFIHPYDNCTHEQNHMNIVNSSMCCLGSRSKTLPSQTIGGAFNKNSMASAAPVTSSIVIPNTFSNWTYSGELNRNVMSTATGPWTTSSVLTTTSFFNQKLGNEVIKNMRSTTGFPITSSGMRPNMLWKQTVGDEFNQNIKSSGTVVPPPYTRIMPSSFPNQPMGSELNKNTMSVTGHPITSSSSTPNSFPNLDSEQFFRNVMSSLPSTSTTSANNNTDPNNYTDLVGKSRIVPTVISTNTNKVTDTIISGKNIIEATNYGKELHIETVIPKPSSRLTSDNFQIQKIGQFEKSSILNEISTFREPSIYPTPPSSGENASLGDIGDIPVISPSNQYTNTSVPSSKIEDSEEKPVIAENFNPESSINIKDDPGDFIDLTWLDDDEVKPESLTDDFSLSPEDPHILILDNRKCLCGEEAIYLCACSKVMYCSQKCQFTDWLNHEKDCSA